MQDSVYSDLLIAFTQPGCPVCWFVERAEEAYLKELVTKKLDDQETRRRIREGLGFCNDHARFLTSNNLIDSLNLAILYHDILLNALMSLTGKNTVQRPPAQLSVWFDRLFRKKNSHADLLSVDKQCPACLERERATNLFLTRLEETGSDESISKALSTSGGLCLPYLFRAIEQVHNDEVKSILLTISSDKLEALRRDLTITMRNQENLPAKKKFSFERNLWIKIIKVTVGERAGKFD
jgi:hypothetical protein